VTKLSGAICRRRTPVEQRAGAAPLRPEAIAMRRLVAATGFWLSPLLRAQPLPVLSEWEATVDLANLAKLKSEEERREARNLFEKRLRAEVHPKTKPKPEPRPVVSRDDRERERLRKRTRTPEQLERKRQKDRERHARMKMLRG